MTPSLLFSVFSTLAMLGWLYLIAVARWHPKSFAVVRIVLPLAISLAYLVCMIRLAPDWQGGFSSIEEVRLLFSNDWGLTAGWVHYLAFDFFVGCWILEKAIQEKISHWILSPILVATFTLGPIGLLLFSSVRRPSSNVLAA